MQKPFIDVSGVNYIFPTKTVQRGNLEASVLSNLVGCFDSDLPESHQKSLKGSS